MDASVFATVQRGAFDVVTTGTVRLAPTGATYEDGPNEHLVLVTATGESMHFEVGHMMGNLQSGAEGFFAENHELAFRYWDDTGHDATLASVRSR